MGIEPITNYLELTAIKEIAAKYGPCLEKLTNSQKLDVMGILALWVATAIDEEDEDAEDIHWSEVAELNPDSTVEDILNQCDDLAPDEAVILITAIACCITV
jgi:hypothetical protein